MPPPTASDEWLTARRFGIVIDAGSSGSRLQIYSWKDARVITFEEGTQGFRTLPKVTKGTRDGLEWVSKVEPGISTFGEHPDQVAKYLAPLLEHARNHIPPSLEAETPLFLLATAGMRLLPTSQQTEVLKAACHFLKFHSHFRIEEPSAVGPCGSSVRIISGEEEGLFGWIAVNYLMDGFTQQGPGQTTYGFLDMGGASTQIAFEPSEEERKNSRDLSDVRLRLLSGEEIHHQVFVTTWLGYGTNQARERYVGEAINRFEETRRKPSHADPHPSDDVIIDPCLPTDLKLVETPVHSLATDQHSRKSHHIVGTGSFEQCLKQVAPLLNKHAPCPDAPCLFNGVHVPHIDFAVSHFIGVSEYWYSSEHVFGLGGAYDFVQFERAASEFCSHQWSDILDEHARAKEQGKLGGDSEAVQGGRVVDAGKWGDKVEISRLQMQCFKSAWIVNVLHEGLGMPRIVDPGGNSTSNPNKPNIMADQKGLGRPTFQSLDTIGDTAISWTLGKMVLEASREVPTLSKQVPPLADPVSNAGSRGGQILDFDSVEGQIAHHLPPFLTRQSLGFSALGLLFYVCCISMVAVVLYRMRRQVAAVSRRFMRKAFKSGDSYDPDHLSLEDAYPMAAGPPSPSSLPFGSWLSPLQRMARLFFSQARSSTSPVRTTPLRPIPQRTFSSSYQNAFTNGNMYGNSGLSGNGHTSGATTPPAFQRELSGGAGQALYTLSRSRNNSQLNLTTLIPRQAPSRGGSSGQQTPTHGSFYEGD